MVTPQEINKELYSVVRDFYNKKEKNINIDKYYEDYYIGYSSRFFEGGYVGITKTGIINYPLEAYHNIIQQIKDIELYCCDYKELIIPDKSIIYCDIPYKDTKKYSTSKKILITMFFIIDVKNKKVKVILYLLVNILCRGF